MPLQPSATARAAPSTPEIRSHSIPSADLMLCSPTAPPSHTPSTASKSHTRSQSWSASATTTVNDLDDTSLAEFGPNTQSHLSDEIICSPDMTMGEEDLYDAVKTPLRRVPRRRPTTRGKKRAVDDTVLPPPAHGSGHRSRSESKSISPKHSPRKIVKPESSTLPQPEDRSETSSMSLDSELLTPPAPPSTELKRRIAPLRSSRSSLFASCAPIPSPIQPYAYRDKPASRESSPVPTPGRNDSSPLKKPRTSLSGEIINFHYSSDSDSDSDTPSPTLRTRARFNHLLGPSPLQKSFSTSTSNSPPSAYGALHKSISSSSIPTRPSRTPLASHTDGQSGPFLPERSTSSPLVSRTGSIVGSLLSPGEVLSPFRARNKILSEVEGLETELNKVFALVHGKGLGLGAGGRGRRSVSGLRSSKTMDASEGKVQDGSPAPKRRSGPFKEDKGDAMELDVDG